MAVRHCILFLTVASLAFAASSEDAWQRLEDDSLDKFSNDDDYQGDAPIANTITTCAATCQGTPTKFQYATGKSYEYRYEGDIKTSVPGTTAEHSSLHLRASAVIEVISTCEMVLRVNDVSLQDSDPSKYETRQHIASAIPFKRALQAKPLSFAFVDGKIESVCPPTDEEVWVVNIKRGILSAFQNTMATLQGSSNLEEIDVTGDCPVKYEMMTGSRKLKKTKNLLACTSRNSAQTIFQGIDYDSSSDVQSIPLMKSTHECEQEIDTRKKILTKTTCSEKHIFRPFANEKSGATTEVTYKLTFTKQTDGTQALDSSPRTRSTLLYDHTITATEMTESMREAQQTITQLCQQISADVRPNAPSLFSTLVKQMRKLDQRNLQQLMTSTKSTCAKSEKIFRDALPLLETTGAIRLMRNMISQNKISSEEIDLWMTSLAFIKNPTQDMIQEVKPLLSSDFDRSALPVSSLINTYCRIYDAAESDEVKQIIKMFEDELKYNCKSETEEQTSRMLKALKSIGNAGNADRVAPTLNLCVANTKAPIVIRVAAINAFRRMDCSVSRNTLFSLLEDKQADSELRINAYLQTMQCADSATIDRVKVVLASEEINQVGSFIWTHLTNLQETESPLKASIRAILEDAEFQKNFDIDKRKFSRNIEVSTFFDSLNMGGSLESNLIWSEKSFVPRSAMVNITVDMFGQSVNLVEVGGRAQGLEATLERLFGPGKEFENALKRDRRAVVTDDMINAIDRKYQKTRDDPALSYYLRVFGNEIRTGELFNLDVDAIKNRFNFLDWLIQLAQDHQVDITRNFQFIDTSITIPTGLGLPLKLSVEGTATVSLSANGKIDIRQMFSSPSVFDINGSVRPSAALELRGEMGVENRYVKSGLKISNTLHTSTVLDGKIQLKDGKIFNFDLNLPTDKIEIFSAESHLYVMYRGQDREQQAMTNGGYQAKRCTGDKMVEIIGLELCGEVSIPGRKEGLPSFPLSGPAYARLYLQKRDTLTGLHFEASYVSSRADLTDVVRVSFNTPGSQINRELTIDFNLNRNRKEVKLNINSPWKKIAVEGALTNENRLKKATLTAKLDETTEYSISTEVAIAETATFTKYTPKLLIVIPGRQNIIFDGNVTYAKGRKAEVKLALKNAFSQTVALEGLVQMLANSKYNISGQLISAPLRAGFTGSFANIQDSGNSWATRADINYQFKNAAKERIVINHKIRDTSSSNLKSYSMDSSWTTTYWPKYNGQVSLELAHSANSIRTKIEAGLDNIKKITITQSGAFDFTGVDKKFNGMIKLELPYKDWNYELKLDHIHNNEGLQSNATVRYAEDKQASFDVGFKKENSKFLSYLADMKLKLPTGYEFSSTASLLERAPREYYGNMGINIKTRRWTKNGRVNGNYKIGQRHEWTSEINLPEWSPITITGHLNPNLKHFQAHNTLSYNGKSYSIDGQFTHRGTGAAFNTRASAEVTYPGKRHGASFEVSRRNQDFTSNFEIKLAENVAVTFSSQITAVLSSPKLQARFEWPENFVALNVIGKYETKGWLTSTNDLEGSIKFTSSIQPFEELTGSFRLDHSHHTEKATAEISWAPNQKIAGEFLLEKTRVTINATTPFSGYQTMKFTSNYLLKGKSLTHNTKVQWENNHVTFALTGEANNLPALTGKATLTTSFRGYESIIVNLKNSVSGGKYQTSADVTWARGQQIAIVLNMNHASSGWAITNNGDLTIRTPFRRFQMNKYAWSHENNDKSWKCHHEVEAYGQKYAFDLEGAVQMTRAIRKVTGKTSFSSLHEGYKNFGINMEYQHDPRGIHSIAKANAFLEDKSITYEHELKYLPDMAALLKAKITTPFQKYETFGIDFNNRKDGKTYTAANEIDLARIGKINLGGAFTLDGYLLDANLRLTTPCPYMERVSMAIKNTKSNDGTWVTRGDIDYSPDKSYSAESRFGPKKFELDINTPHEYMRTMKFLSSYSGIARNFQVTSELQHNKFRNGKMTLSFSADTLDFSRTVQSQIAIRTPFADFSNFKASIRHAYENAERCLTTGSYELNRNRGSLNIQVNKRSWGDFTTKTELTYISNKKIILETQVSTDPSILVSASLQTPFQNAQQLSFKITEEGPIDNMKAGLEIKYAPRQTIAFNTNLKFSDKQISARARLTTPFSALERAVVALEHNGQSKKFATEAAVEWNDKRIATITAFELNDANLKFSSSLETPFRSLNQASIKIEHSGRWTDFNNNAALNYNGQEITASSEFKKDGLTGKFDLRTPYEAVQSLCINFQHTNKITRYGNGWSNTGSVEYNGQRYAGESEWVWVTKTQIKSKFAVTIPDEYSLTLTHRGELSDFSNSAILKLASSRITATSSFKMNNNLIEAKAGLDTTYRGYEKFELTFKQAGPADNFKTSASFTTPLRRYQKFSFELTHRGTAADFSTALKLESPLRDYTPLTVTLTHRGNTDDFSTTFKLESPIRDYSPLTVTLTHRGNMQRLNSELTATCNGKVFKATTAFSMDRSSLTGSLGVQTPFDGYENFGLNFQYSGMATDFQSSFSVNTPFRGYERFSAEINHSGEAKRFRTSAKFESSLPDMPTITLSLTHNNPNPSKRTAVLEIGIPAGTILTSFNQEYSRDTAKINFKITTPFSRFDKFELALEHEKNSNTRSEKSMFFIQTPCRYLKSYRSTAEAQDVAVLKSTKELITAIPNWERFASAYSHEIDPETGSVQGSFQVETPFAGWEKTSVAVNHIGKSVENLKTTVSLETSQRGFEKQSVVFEHQGQTLENIKTSLTVETSVRGFEKQSVSFALQCSSLDNIKSSLSLETSQRGYEKQSASFSHFNSRRGVKTSATVETSVPGYRRFSVLFDHVPTRKVLKYTLTVDTPFRGYEKVTGLVEHTFVDVNAFRTNVQLSGSAFNAVGATLSFTGDYSQFETTTKFTLPIGALQGIDPIEVSIQHRGNMNDFVTGGSVVYSGKKIEFETGFKKTGNENYELRVKAATPCPYFRDLNLLTSHRIGYSEKSGQFELNFNGEKKADLDYKYTSSGDQDLTINVRHPYPMETTMNLGGSNGVAVINWDTTRNDRKVQFDFGLKNVVSSSLVDRAINFKTTTSRRTVGFAFAYTLSAERFTHKGELQWDRDAENEFAYQIEGSRTTRRGLQTIDGTLKVTSALFNTISTISHKATPGRRYTTEIALQTTERLTIKNDVTLTNSGFKHELTIQHPRFSKDVTITTEKSGDNFKTTISYDRQTINVEGQLSINSVRSAGYFRFNHPNSFTDIQLNGDVSSDYEKTAANFVFKYMMSRDRQLQTSSLRTLFNGQRKEINIELATPIQAIQLTSVNRELNTDKGIVSYDVILKADQLFYHKTSIDFSLPDRKCDIRLYKSEESYVQLFGQVASPTRANFEINRVNNDQTENDASASLILSDDRLLTGRAFVRPNLWRDIQSSFQAERYQSQVDAFSSTLIRLKRTVDDDLRLKSTQMKLATKPISDAFNAIAVDFNNKLDEVKATFMVLYRNNDFYIRDIDQYFQRVTAEASRYIQRKMAEWQQCYANFVATADRRIRQALHQVYAQIVQSFRALSDRVNQYIPDIDTLRPHFEQLAITIKTKFNELLEKIRSHPRIRALIEKLEKLEPADLIPSMIELKNKLQERYNYFKSKLDESITRPEVKQFVDWVINKIAENKWMYQVFGLEDQVNKYLEQLRSLTWASLKEKTRTYVAEYFQFSKNRWTVWDPVRGEYAFQIYIPFDLPDLTFLQKLNIQKYIDQANTLISKYIPDEDWSMLDTIYSYKPSQDIGDWVPPFKGHASLTGAQHYITFDHQMYQFAGECSYLLTRDFVDKSFSVIVNYDKVSRNQPVKKSMTVLCDGKKIEIFPDAKVTIDGTRVEMPIRVDNTTVTRNGNLLRVDNDRGINIVCDLPHDHCSISVSGWYYGKMAGLLGTYDNEPSNDLTTIDSAISDRPEIFADSWSVGTPKCRPVNRAINVPIDTETKNYKMCADLFKEQSSPFRSCFKVVDPEKYLKMCVQDMPISDNREELPEDVCRVAAAYYHECRRHEVHVRLPKECVKCQVGNTNRYFLESDSITMTSSNEQTKMADVVFVMQHAPCNRDLVDKVKGMVDDLNKAMNLEGITSTRYALVGFGGKSHMGTAHIHTMDGQIFNTANKVLQSNFETAEAGTERDALAAIRYAARLPFRAGASKTIILLPCDSCREETIRYTDIQRALLYSDIRLHVLVQDLIKLKSQSAKTAYIFGIDETTVYTRKDVASEDLAGESDLRRYIRLPKDLCAALTQDTDGSIFSAKQWLDSRPQIQKRFVDVMVRTFARKAIPTECQICSCVADEVGVGASQCTSCQPRIPIYRNMPDFPEDDEEVATTPSQSEVTTRANDSQVDFVTAAPRPLTPRPPQARTTPMKKPKVKPVKTARPPVVRTRRTIPPRRVVTQSPA